MLKIDSQFDKFFDLAKKVDMYNNLPYSYATFNMKDFSSALTILAESPHLLTFDSNARTQPY